MKYIGDILEENFKDGHIDFMSVDVEGMGARIVNAIDFNWYDIDVILWKWTSIRKSQENFI